ncbi:MAG TPA: hypothetical protein VJT49_21720 [Amycolatopsis sp.]|nr:hypothetical protein [Amycolatopsis sp.]
MGESSLFLTRMLDVLCDGGNKIAFAHRSRSMTYRDTFDSLRRLHGTLKTEGIAPGQLVAITGGNMPETFLLQIAAHLRGARVAHVTSPTSVGDLHADHIISANPEGPLLLARSGAATAEADIALPREVETLFPLDDRFVCERESYEELARTCRPRPDGPQRVLLIAPMSHPIGNRITCKALLSGDTVVLHERAPEEAVMHTSAR